MISLCVAAIHPFSFIYHIQFEGVSVCVLVMRRDMSGFGMLLIFYLLGGGHIGTYSL